MTQTEAAEMTGSGAPYRHPVAEQFRLLPVSLAEAAPSVKHFPRQDFTLYFVFPESGDVMGGTLEPPPPV